MNTQSQSISNSQHNKECGKYFGLSVLLSSSEVYSQLAILLRYAKPVVAAGQVAYNSFLQGKKVAFMEYVGDRRKMVGLVFGVAGILSIWLHTIFFMQYEKLRDFNWYYINNFYFVEALRFWIVICLFSVAFFLHVPVKYKSIWVVFALTFAVGLCGIIHYSFFVNSFETFHSIPAWEIIVISIAFGAGFIKASDYLCYRKYHLKDGNAARIMGVFNISQLTWEQKKAHFESLKEEMENFNARI